MKMAMLDAGKHPAWGVPLLLLLIWHITDTVLNLSPQYLFFVCYSANLLLCIGIFRRSALLVGIGFGWLLIAFPLWLYDAILTHNWEPSCTLFHIVGLMVGSVVIRSYRLPRHTWLFAMMLGIALQLLARLFTDEALNINSAFRIYQGWEAVYPNYVTFFAAMLLGFSMFFMAMTWLHNRYVHIQRQIPLNPPFAKGD
jgi:hypothetical protein